MSQFKNFEEFFFKATTFEPYPYQSKLASSEIPNAINIPTGTGKTETAILALWLWRRLIQEKDTPKRLIYCLPRRVLVEQTKERVEEWLKALNLEERIGVALLMGGNQDEELEKHPSKEYIIIGTQDVLISGALNRTYGSSPYRWPVIFGLLNNDCMWVLDEIQIMENGLPTSVQLDAFRKSFKTYGTHNTLWMSATLNPEWLKTINSSSEKLSIYELSYDDCNNALNERNNAVKTLHKADFVLNGTIKDVQCLHKLHKSGTVTAIIVNTVKRAQELNALFNKNNIKCKLIHSRFRSADRRELNNWIKDLKEDQDQIIISTQVLEAGVDISIRTLITEIAPWANMVQRFGRCNRNGIQGKVGDVYWIDTVNEFLPYEKDAIDSSRKELENLTEKSISPNNLPKIKEKKFFDSILRKKDLIDFFDTTSDLSGSYTDPSRFVRSSKKSMDVRLFWRDSINEKSNVDLANELRSERDEICNVPIHIAKKLLSKNNVNGYVWDYAYETWNKVWGKDLFPGQTVMLDSKLGGYSEEIGFDHTITDKVNPISKIPNNKNNSHDPDGRSIDQKISVTLEDHTGHVLYEMFEIIKDLEFLEANVKTGLIISAGYHDIGKLHKTFQDTINKGLNEDEKNAGKFWAKSRKSHQHERVGFRHEVASALSYLKQEKHSKYELRDLVAYLIITHHGKVRLSLRSTSKKEERGTLLGIKDGDKIPQFSFPKSFEIKSSTNIKTDQNSLLKFNLEDISIEKEISLDMSLATIGRNDSSNPSWVERSIKLLNLHGPFRLAYLESVIRAADTLASKKENEVNPNE